MSIEISIGTWIWDHYGKLILRQAGKKIKDQWQKFNWEVAAKSYRESVYKLYGEVRILGMTESIPLNELYIEVRVLDKNQVPSNRYIELENFESIQENSNKHISTLRLISKVNKLFLLGKPGSGKTTLLNYIALQAAENRINKIPIYVSLKGWTDSTLSLIDFIAYRFDICAFPDAKPFIEQVLKAGQAILLFDGLDEVRKAEGIRAIKIQELRDFILKYTGNDSKKSKNKFLVTCRLGAEDYFFYDFTYAQVTDFGDNQIFSFASRWFKNNQVKRDKFINECNKSKNKGFMEIAQTPLLLALLCIVFNEKSAFPERKSELYSEALNILLKKWDYSRGIDRDEIYFGLTTEKKRELFSIIAFRTFCQYRILFDQQYLESEIKFALRRLQLLGEDERSLDTEEIIKGIEAHHGIFIHHANRIYSFSHLTFHEYFTAQYIIMHASTEDMDICLGFYSSEYGQDNRWFNIFLLAASQVSFEFSSIFFENIICRAQKIVIRDQSSILILSRIFKNASLISGKVNKKALHQAAEISRNKALELSLNLISKDNNRIFYMRICSLAYCIMQGIALSKVKKFLDHLIKVLDESDFDFDLEIPLVQATNANLKEALDFLKFADMHDLFAVLSFLPEPPGTPNQWRIYNRKVQVIMNEYLKLGLVCEYEFNNIYEYLKIIELIIDCLPSTTMSNKEKIEDSLLVLPFPYQ